MVVYKIDRLTRSLADFAKLVEAFDARSISFVAVTQQFNTTTSMGRLTLNVLLSFAQFERELSSERVRDKIAASRRKGKWTGGTVPLGYDAKDKSSSSTRPRPRPSGPSSAATLNCGRSAGWLRILITEASLQNSAAPRSPSTMAAFPSPTVRWPTSSRTGSISARSIMAVNGSRASMRPSSTARPSTGSNSFLRPTPMAARQSDLKAAPCSRASSTTTRAIE